MAIGAPAHSQLMSSPVGFEISDTNNDGRAEAPGSLQESRTDGANGRAASVTTRPLFRYVGMVNTYVQ